MKEFLSKRWLVILLVAVLLCLIMAIMAALSGGRVSQVSNFVNILTTPIQNAATSVGNAVRSGYDHLFAFDQLKAENEQLKSELADTQQKLRDAEKAEKENVQLRAALNMKERSRDLVFESAEIIARSNENWATSFTIDKGTLAGIALDNCVITDEGMVGFVSEVGTTWAVITAVTDTSMEASAIVSRTREVASAEGDFELMKEGYLKLSYLERDTQVIKGDTVEISGLGGLFPKGIVLGTVEEVRTESHGISKYALIRPAVDLAKVNHVLVIKSFAVTE